MTVIGMLSYAASRIYCSIPSHKVDYLILNCHGFYLGGRGGYGLKIGQGIHRKDTGEFARLKGLVKEIWLRTCGAARISKLTKDVGGVADGEGDGNLLCQEIAKASGAYVVAPTTKQQIGLDGFLSLDGWTTPKDVSVSFSHGHIDNMEGLVVRYNPEGICVGKTDHGRSFINGLVNGWN
jgi:hypothetical protein